MKTFVGTTVTVVEATPRGSNRGQRRHWYVLGSCGHRTLLDTLPDASGAAVEPVGATYECPLCPGGWAGPPLREVPR